MLTKKWKTIRIQSELEDVVKSAVKRGDYSNVSEFVTEAIHMQLQKLAVELIPKYLEQNMNIRMFEMQEKLLYTPKHIWVQLTPQGTVKLGVTKYFVKKVKGIAFIETHEIGTDISKDESFALAETPAWWFLRDLISPINGKIIEINKEVTEDPVGLCENPYQWIVELQTDDSNLQKVCSKLLNFKEYKELTAKIEDLGHFPNMMEQNKIIKMIRS